MASLMSIQPQNLPPTNMKLKHLVACIVVSLQKKLIYVGLVCLVVTAFGCSSSQKSADASGGTSSTTVASNSSDNSSSSVPNDAEVDWSIIKDEMSTPHNKRFTVLEAFAIQESGSETDNYIENRRGYRVQIDFTRDMNSADSLKNSFNYRIRQLLNIEHKAEANVIYRPPYYRIRVGDFKDRLVALEYTKLLKKYYPSSWVVADDINNSLVPAKGKVIKDRGYGSMPPDSSSYRQN